MGYTYTDYVLPDTYGLKEIGYKFVSYSILFGGVSALWHLQKHFDYLEVMLVGVAGHFAYTRNVDTNVNTPLGHDIAGVLYYMSTYALYKTAKYAFNTDIFMNYVVNPVTNHAINPFLQKTGIDKYTTQVDSFLENLGITTKDIVDEAASLTISVAMISLCPAPLKELGSDMKNMLVNGVPQFLLSISSYYNYIMNGCKKEKLEDEYQDMDTSDFYKDDEKSVMGEIGTTSEMNNLNE